MVIQLDMTDDNAHPRLIEVVPLLDHLCEVCSGVRYVELARANGAGCRQSVTTP